MPKTKDDKKKPVQKKVAAKKVVKNKNVSVKEAKKTARNTIKEVKDNSNQNEEITALTFLEAWFDGWKKTFVLRGRSSRFELWCFLLLNSIISVTVQLKCSYIMSSRFLVSATEQGFDINTIDSYIYWAEIIFYSIFLISLFPLGSLLIRRMHDLGKLAWQDCLEPAFMGMCVVWSLFFAICYLSETDYVYTTLLLATCFVTMLYATAYYVLKFLIMTMFYGGKDGQNKYGICKFNTPKYEDMALTLSSFYFLFIATVMLFALVSVLI